MLLPDVPNRDIARSPVDDGKPGAVFGEGDVDNGRACIEFNHCVPRLDVVNAKFAVGAADEKKQAVNMEGTTSDFGFDVDLRNRLQRRKVVEGKALVASRRGQDASARVHRQTRDGARVRPNPAQLAAIAEDNYDATLGRNECPVCLPGGGRHNAASR